MAILQFTGTLDLIRTSLDIDSTGMQARGILAVSLLYRTNKGLQEIEMRLTLLLIAFVFAASTAQAQEFFLLGGAIENNAARNFSYSWQLEYRQALGEHIAASISYLNEGHFINHHRDGNTIQLWAQTTMLDQRLSLAAGVGPYYFFDTTSKASDGSSINDRGWGGALSLSATLYTESRWLFQLRANWVGIDGKFDTLSTVAGIGYQLEQPSAPKPSDKEIHQKDKTTANEVTVFLGQTITNTLDTSQDIATSIEYRRGLARHLDWTVAWLYEGDEHLIRRNGVTTQLWAVRPFLDDRLVLGVGGGGYFAIEQYHELINGKTRNRVLSGIFTLTGSYRLHPQWAIRTSWNRIITKYNMDTDVILGGLGYLF